MIVRILGEGQFRLPDDELDVLNELDDVVEAAAVAGDAVALAGALTRLLEEVRRQGVELDPDLLIDSDLILPDAEATVQDVRAWIGQDSSFEGLLP